MKTLLIVLGVLFLAALLFVLIGIVSPGQQSENRVEINAPLDFTWDIYHDQDMLKKWVPGLDEIKLKTRKGSVVGAEYELSIIDQAGTKSTMHEKITTFDKPNRFGMDYSNSMLTGNTEVLFEAQGDSTIVIAKNNYKGTNIFLRSMFHFFAGKITEQTTNQYADLKTLVETTYSEKQAAKPKMPQPPLLESAESDTTKAIPDEQVKVADESEN